MISAMRAQAAPSHIRPGGILLCVVCLLLLMPALVLAYCGAGWLDVKPPYLYSAVACILGPFPFACGAAFGWKAARDSSRSHLLRGLAALMLSLPIYTVVWAWGGRMLI